MLPRCLLKQKHGVLFFALAEMCYVLSGERDINEARRQEIARRMLNARVHAVPRVLESEKSTVMSIFRYAPLEIRC